MTRRMIVLTAAFAALSVAACDGSKKQLEATLAQVQTISAEKDSLLKDVMATSQFIAEVNTELAKVRSRAAGKPVAGKGSDLENNLTPAQQREAIKARVAELTTRMNESEARLTASRNRVRDLTANNAALSTQLAGYDSTIASFQKMVDQQKAEIASLTEQINSLQAENTTLKQDKVALAAQKDTVIAEKQALVVEKNTVFYVIGTEDELFKKGIIAKQGGLLGLGKTAVPGATMNDSDFTAVDRTNVMDIAFPKADKAYKIVSRQDVTALATAPDKSNRIKGGLKITDAVKFWAPSKYLILMEQ
jgi:predicted  nucleic acid-binding Zn-ribbon protein